MQGVPPAEAMDRIQAKIVPLGQRFHGSESSFPFSSYLLYRFRLCGV
jgi:nuclear pore complex protein Nup155